VYHLLLHKETFIFPYSVLMYLVIPRTVRDYCPQQHKRLVSILEVERILCEVGNGFLYNIYIRVHKFSKNLGTSSNLLAQSGDMKEIPYWRPTILQWSVNLPVFWRFLLGAYELIYIFNARQKCSNCAADYRRHHPIFSRPADQVHLI
jgi:hypothetical protein